MSKLFQIRRYTDPKQIEHLEIHLLGAKMRLPVPNKQLLSYFPKKIDKMRQRRQFKSFLKKELPEFTRKKEEWLHRPEKKLLRRLFITTGNFQLINSLAIIEQLKSTEHLPVENHILIQSHVTNPAFEDLNRSIARAFGISHFHVFCGPKWDEPQYMRYLMENDLYAIDQVYSLQSPGHLKVYNTFYRGCEHIVTDESFITLLPNSEVLAMECKKLITTCYLGKLDYVDFPGRPWRVEYLHREYFERVAARCVEMYPWPEAPDKEGKTVLFCATYVTAWDKLAEERQRFLMRSLLERGYRILYKPHPRDPVLPQESTQLKILRTRLPLECYRMEGVLGVVSLNSSASTQSYHYSGVPGFIDYLYSRESSPEHVGILAREYTPSVECLLKLDAREMPHDELREKLLQAYKAHVEPKPMMSQNELFLKSFHSMMQRKS